MFGRAGRRRRRRPGRASTAAFGGFTDIFDAFFGGAAARRRAARPPAARRGPALRPADHVRGGRPRAPRRRSSSRSSGRCETCGGNGAKPGTEPITCPQCNGRGEVRTIRQTMLGQMVNVTRLPALPAARARSSRRRARRATATAGPSASGRSGSRSRPGSTRATRSASRTRARSGRAAGRRAACTSPSTSRRTRRSRARAPSSSTRPTSRSPRRRSGRAIAVPTVDGDEEVEIKPGTQPGTEIRLRGKGVPHLRRTGSKGDLHVFVDVVVPTKLSKKQRELLDRVRGRERRGRSSRASGPARQGPRRARLRATPAATRRRCGRRRPTGAWLELSVEADVEAVEAVSEILGRVAPGGTSVEPAFELVDEGLGARIDPTRPAIVRAYLPAPRSAPRPSGPSPRSPTALGHLQAFGLRPIGELTTRVVHEADWAEAWKAYFPVLRVGRRLVIRPTWRRHRRAARTTSSSRSIRGWRSGPGSIRRRGCASPALEARRRSRASLDGRAGPRRRLRLGDPRDRGRPARRGAVARRRHGPDRGRGDRGERPRATGSRGGSRRARAACRRGEPPFDVVLANLIAGVLVALARELARRAPAGRHARSRRGSSSTARPRSATRSRPSGCEVRDRSAEGDWVALEAVRSRAHRNRPLSGRALQSPAHAGLVPAPARHAHHPRRQPVPALDPAAVRAAHAAGGGREPEPDRPVPPLDAGHGTVVIGIGLALTGVGLVLVARQQPASSQTVAARRPGDLRGEPRHRVLRPAAEPAPARRHPGRRRRPGLARAGEAPALRRLRDGRRSSARSGS